MLQIHQQTKINYELNISNLIFKLLFKLLSIIINYWIILNMYSELQKYITNNNYVPQQLQTPVYTLGNFLLNPFGFNEFPVFTLSSFYSQSNYANVNYQPCQNRSTQAINQDIKINKTQVKEKTRNQVVMEKKKSSNSKKNKKIIQKDTRNIFSNLLKIFFKNLLDLRIWDSYLQSLIKKHKFSTSLKSFYLWLNTFKVNYKSYIKTKQIEILLKVKECKHYQLLFRALLKRYLQNEGISHCLTSRKIGRTAIRRHIEALRQLNILFVLQQI